jgi:hypothetical protein
MAIEISVRWSTFKAAVLKDPIVKNNAEMLKTWKEQFKIFDQGLTSKAKTVEKDYKKMASGGIPKMKDLQDLKTKILELRGLVIKYQQQVEFIKKGYLKKFPQSVGTFKLVEKQLEVIKENVDNELNAIG